MRRGLLSVCPLLVVLALATGSASASSPTTPFASVAGTCSAGSFSNFQSTRISGNHPYVVVRLTAQGGPGELDGNNPAGSAGYGPSGLNGVSFGGADTLWTFYSDPTFGDPTGLQDQDFAYGNVDCADATVDVAYTVDYFDLTTTPTQFMGADTLSGTHPDNTLSFATPAAAHYVADLSLTQGAVALSDGTVNQTFASSGRFDLGILARDTYGLALTPEDGPQAKWSVTIHALPVVLSGLKFDRQFERATQITTASYSLDGDVTLTATIRNSAQQVVRSLASSTHVPIGAHSLTWDGLDSAGSPVPDGTYTLAISYVDAAGNSGGGQTSVVVDDTPPTVNSESPQTLKPTQGLVVDVGDALSGVVGASLSVDGKKVRSLGTGETQFVYVPSGGWRGGTHSFAVAATDKAGNTANQGGSFIVRQRAYVPSCAGPRYKPASLKPHLAGGCARFSLRKIHWKTWTSASAAGTGSLRYNDCTPSCARGHYRSRPGTRLKLSAPKRCRSNGRLEFRRLRLTFHGKSETWYLAC
jgi:flagellar hook capping protein FlgD